MSLPAKTDVLIAGGGLAGLFLADMLAAQGRDYHLIEARSRLGGRVLSHVVGGAAFDLGPAWIWPGQPRVAALVDRFGLQVFAQYTTGDFRVETADGRIQQGRGRDGMQGSLRIAGGIGRLVDALSTGLDSGRVHLSTPLASCARIPAGVLATCASGAQIAARHVVLTLPPRVASDLHFAPALAPAATTALRQIPTWMAGQAKAVAIYDTAFWRAQGLSGHALSHRGPLVEIHDASPHKGTSFALFGFIAVPPHHRHDVPALKSAVLAQLTRIFGPAAATPREIVVKDWAHDPATATRADHAAPATHPRYGLPGALAGLWDDALLFGGTEVASDFGGYIEGALEAAEQAFDRLSDRRQSASNAFLQQERQ